MSMAMEEVVFEENGLLVHVRKGLLEGLRDFLASPERFLKDAELLKEDRGIKAWRLEVAGKGLFVKRYTNRGPVHTVKNIFRASRALRVWRNSLMADSIGLSVPATLAFMEERRMGVLKSCYIVQEFIEDGLNLYFFINAHRDREVETIGRVAREVGRMHRRGWFHGDLKWPNMVLNNERVYFIDIEASLLEEPLPEGYMLKDLSRFARDMEAYGSTEKAKAVFYMAYLELNPLGLGPERLRERVERERGFRKT